MIKRERDEYREIDREGESGYRDRRERAINQKKWVERERAYKNGLVERNNKIIKKIDYLNKRGDRIDELM